MSDRTICSSSYPAAKLTESCHSHIFFSSYKTMLWFTQCRYHAKIKQSFPWISETWQIPVSVGFSKDINLIPRKQKVIKLLQFLATVPAWKRWREAGPALRRWHNPAWKQSALAFIPSETKGGAGVGRKASPGGTAGYKTCKNALCPYNPQNGLCFLQLCSTHLN